MKKVLTIVTIFCFCLSLFAAEGEAEKEKEKRPSWNVDNLLYGPKELLAAPFFGLISTFHYGFFGPLVIPVYAIDGAIHIATFGLFAHPGDDYDNLLILRSSTDKQIFEEGVASYQKKAEKGSAWSIARLSDVYYNYYKKKWDGVLAEKRALFIDPKRDRQMYEQEKQEYIKIKSETLKWLDKAVKAGEEEDLSASDYKTAKERYDLIMRIPDPWDWNDDEWEKNPTHGSFVPWEKRWTEK